MKGTEAEVVRHWGGGTVLAFDRPAGRMVVDVRYVKEGDRLPHSPYPPLVIPVPTAAPDWLFRVGAHFRYSHPRGYQTARAYQTDPALMRDFEPLEYWWCTTDELERMLGYRRDREPAATRAEVIRRQEEAAALRAEVESRRPAEYVPTDEEAAGATRRLREWFPEWLGVARL